MLSRHTIKHELTIVFFTGVTYIRPASKRNRCCSNDRYDTRLLVGGDFLLGDHGDHQGYCVIAIARSSSIEAINSRKSQLCRDEVPGGRWAVRAQERNKAGQRAKRNVYLAYRRAVTERGSSDTWTTHGGHPGGVGTITASDRR